MNMFRLSPRRNPRSKGFKVKHGVQACLLFAVCIWLLYQIKHSHYKKAAFVEDAKDGNPIKLGRKDPNPVVQTTTANEDVAHTEEESIEGNIDGGSEDKTNDGNEELDPDKTKKEEESVDMEKVSEDRRDEENGEHAESSKEEDAREDSKIKEEREENKETDDFEKKVEGIDEKEITEENKDEKVDTSEEKEITEELKDEKGNNKVDTSEVATNGTEAMKDEEHRDDNGIGELEQKNQINETAVSVDQNHLDSKINPESNEQKQEKIGISSDSPKNQSEITDVTDAGSIKSQSSSGNFSATETVQIGSNSNHSNTENVEAGMKNISSNNEKSLDNLGQKELVDSSFSQEGKTEFSDTNNNFDAVQKDQVDSDPNNNVDSSSTNQEGRTEFSDTNSHGNDVISLAEVAEVTNRADSKSSGNESEKEQKRSDVEEEKKSETEAIGKSSANEREKEMKRSDVEEEKKSETEVIDKSPANEKLKEQNRSDVEENRSDVEEEKKSEREVIDNGNAAAAE